MYMCVYVTVNMCRPADKGWVLDSRRDISGIWVKKNWEDGVKEMERQKIKRQKAEEVKRYRKGWTHCSSVVNTEESD